MSAIDPKSAQRPEPDRSLVDIADYALSYEVTSDAAYETAFRFITMPRPKRGRPTP